MDFVVLACIVKPHGVKGDVVLHVFCKEPLGKYLPLCDRNGNSYSLQSIREMGRNTVAAHVPGVETRDQAEILRTCELGVERGRLPSLEAGTFYVHDLLGVAVLDAETGELCGQLTYVHDFGAGSVLEVKTLQGKRLHAPFQAVSEVDVAQKKLKIDGRFLI